MTLEYREEVPPEQASLIRCVWSLKGTAPADAGLEPLVSDGCVEVVFNFADRFEARLPDRSRHLQPAQLVVGPTALPTLVRPTGRVDIVGIRLQPWAGAAVLGLPMTEIRDRQLDLADLESGTLRELADRLEEPDRRVDRVGAVLDELKALSVAQEVDWLARTSVVRLLREAKDGPSIRDLARQMGRSTRTLERVFLNHVGLSPRTLARIIRIQRALGQARSEPKLRWSAVAIRAGYYDQAHFVRDFKSLVGCLPSEFRPEPQSLTTSFLA
jgi:AraC-like DNA-binding protein